MRYECFSKRRERRLSQWHIWFAWYPVHIDGQCVWREYLHRKGTRHSDHAGTWYTFEYTFAEQGVLA